MPSYPVALSQAGSPAAGAPGDCRQPGAPLILTGPSRAGEFDCDCLAPSTPTNDCRHPDTPQWLSTATGNHYTHPNGMFTLP